jgi:Tfp pilus assembly protein PilE
VARQAVKQGMRGNTGFTHIQFLIVVIIFAILAGAAILTFPGQRQTAENAAAHPPIRAMQALLVDMADHSQVAPAAVLGSIEQRRVECKALRIW